MAIYHHSVKIIGRSSGRSSVGAAAYRSGEKIHNEYDGVTHDYTHRNSVASAAYRSGENLYSEKDGNAHDFSKKRGIVYSEIMLPDNAPREFSNRATLWNEVEKSEKRRDAQTAREVEISLPKELSLEQQIELTQEYVKENFVDKGMIADFSIHHAGHEHSQTDKFKDEAISPYNPHAHIMLTMRDVSESGFSKKKNRDWNKKSHLTEWRENWADIANKHLERYGFDERIDHRTLAEQGIDREPMKYMGLNYKYIKEQARLEKWRFKQEMKIENAEVRKIERQIAQLAKDRDYLLALQEKRHKLSEKRQTTRNKKELATLDKEIQTLENIIKYETAESERKLEQLQRQSIRENFERHTVNFRFAEPPQEQEKIRQKIREYEHER